MSSRLSSGGRPAAVAHGHDAHHPRHEAKENRTSSECESPDQSPDSTNTRKEKVIRRKVHDPENEGKREGGENPSSVMMTPQQKEMEIVV